MITYENSPYDNAHSALYRCITYMEDSIMERHLAPQAAPSSSATAAAIERDRVTSLFVSRTIPQIRSLLRFCYQDFTFLSSYDLLQKYIPTLCRTNMLSCPILPRHNTSHCSACWSALLPYTLLPYPPFVHGISLYIFNSKLLVIIVGVPLRVGPVPYGGQRLYPPGHILSILGSVLHSFDLICR